NIFYLPRLFYRMKENYSHEKGKRIGFNQSYFSVLLNELNIVLVFCVDNRQPNFFQVSAGFMHKKGTISKSDPEILITHIFGYSGRVRSKINRRRAGDDKGIVHAGIFYGITTRRVNKRILFYFGI